MTQPNILFIMADDHAAHALGAYGSRINKTPGTDRIAHEGMRFDNAFCTNAICTPSRASILTGTYNHVNGVTTLDTPMDNRLETFPKLLKEAGYQTAVVGKWHLGHGPSHDPSGFDYWSVLPGQGEYHDPDFIEMGELRNESGYCTDIITDKSLAWLESRDPETPFCLLVHHKAPHRTWQPHPKYASLYEGEDLAEPETLFDDHAGRSSAATAAKATIADDLTFEDVKTEPPPGLDRRDATRWYYQQYMKEYLRCVASIDESTERLLDWLESHHLLDTTLIVYTSDQGFFLGDHGWYDKRFMYEESLRMPLLMRYPPMIEPGRVCRDMVTNVDFAATFLAIAGVRPPEWMQGRSMLPLLRGERPPDWPTSIYYRYWMHKDDAHNVYAHYGIRTQRYKLIYFYNDGLELPGTPPGGGREQPEWELYDLADDPLELTNLYGRPELAHVIAELQTELADIQTRVGDDPYEAAST